MPPKMEEMVQKTLRDTEEIINRSLDQMVDFIMKFDLENEDQVDEECDTESDDPEIKVKSKRLQPQEND